jgi:hypothetical protein
LKREGREEQDNVGDMGFRNRPLEERFRIFSTGKWRA